MFGSDDLYSRLVGWAKIILPLTGLALLSTLFLLARAPSQTADLPIAQVAALARAQELNAPEFSGVTDTGAILNIAARRATPILDQPDAAMLDDLRLQMDNPDGSRVDMTSITGKLNGRAGQALLSGLVRIETSSDFTMETNGLTITLDSGLIVSNGLLEIRAPFGVLTAGQVTFRTDPRNIGQQMLFTDGVKLVYQPQD
jgi:lipopolysaccharide export system protein LptC